MSYEGYTQNLCKSGHFFISHDGGEDDYCPNCFGRSVWSNEVDDTNCDSFGEIDLKPFLLKDGESKVCEMGHVHEISARTYRIPSPEETKNSRGWRPDFGNTPLS